MLNLDAQKDSLIQFHELEYIIERGGDTVTAAQRDRALTLMRELVARSGLVKPYKNFCARLQIEPDGETVEAAHKIYRETKHRDGDNSVPEQSALDQAQRATRRLNAIYLNGNVDEYRQGVRHLESDGHFSHLSAGQRVDIHLALARLGFVAGRADAIDSGIEQASEVLSEISDFERRNRLAAYEGLAALRRRDINLAASKFVPLLATFPAYELMTF